MRINPALMGSKTNEFFDERSHVNMASQYSVNGGDVSSSFKRKACDSVQDTTSETSNLISVNSNHYSLFENANSKATPRSVDISNSLEVDMHPNLESGENVEQVEQYPKGRACSIRCEDSRGAHDDSISCVIRANGVYTLERNQSRNEDQKSLSCGSASLSSLDPEYHKKAHEPILSDMSYSKHAISRSSSQKEKVPAECNLFDKEPSLKEAATNDSWGLKFASLQDSDISPDICQNSEAKTSNDGGNPTDVAFKFEKDGKSSEFNKPECQQQFVSGDGSDESDIVEHDVKVCDICGDAGREDLLAICSRCSDGAEHIYCMRKMLKKVPQGNWLCEECKFAEETNNQKQEVEGKRMNKVSSSTKFTGKKITDITEMVPVAKRQALETSMRSPKSSSPVRPSRESSFKNLDRERPRPLQQTSVGNHYNDTVETSRALTTTTQLRTPKGTFLKSNSFSTLNSKPKVTLVEEVVSLKQKGAKEQTSLDMMGRPARLFGKSMSFKSMISGRSNVSDSKVKMLSPKELNHVLDPKGSKLSKERTVFGRKTLTKIDRSPVSSTAAGYTVSMPMVDQLSHVESSLTSSLSNTRDVNSVHCEGKSSSLSKSASNLTRKPNVSAGVSSMNGVQSSATEQTLNHLCYKDESRNNVDGTSHDGLPQPHEMVNQTELIRDNSVCQGPTVTACSEAVVGHAAEYSSIDGSQTCGMDVFATRSSRDEMHEGSKLKDAIQAAILKKPELSRKKKVFEQSDKLSTSNMHINCDAALQNQVLFSSKLNSIVSAERSNEEEAVQGTSTLESYTNSVGHSLMRHAVTSKVGNSDAAVSSLGKLMKKDFLDLVSATSSLLWKTIPEYGYIWQGYFEVHRRGGFLDLYDGIQAHLSTCASPRVLEVTERFSQNLYLHEVPRLSTWPAQFQESGVKDDNIALYFFAKDVESYERNYKSLVDGMIKNDLALKGQFDGVELLIFSSNQLPEKSRRWNMLFYLWGVFRARRTHQSDSSKKLHIPNLSWVPVKKNLSSAVMTNMCYPELVDEKSPASDTVSVQAFENVILDCEQLPTSSEASSALKDGRFHSDLTCSASLVEERRGTRSSLEQNILPNQRLGMELKPSFTAIASNSYSKGEVTELHCDACVDRKDTSSLNILPVSNQEVGYVGSVYEEKISNGWFGSERNPNGLSKVRDLYKTKSEMKEDVEYVSTPAWMARNLTSEGNISCQFNENKHSHIDLYKTKSEMKEDVEYVSTPAWMSRNLTSEGNISSQFNENKHSQIDLSDTTPSASCVAHEKMHQNGRNNELVDGVIISKMPKIGLNNVYGCSSSEEENKCFEACDKKIVLEDLGAAERYFLPVNSRHRSGDNSVPWKSSSAGEDHLNDEFPNLELALGADIRPQNKGILPFFVGSAEKSENEDKLLYKVIDTKEDDASASLSLSLSFPFPDKEQSVKPVSKPEQLRPDSLLFFGGLSDK